MKNKQFPKFKLRFVLHAGLVIGIALSGGLVCSAADSSDANLVKLENKFFEHSFPKDPMPQRLERLEKMVFGESKQGSESERLNKLVQSIPTDTGSSDDSAKSDVAATPSAPKAAPRQAAKPVDDGEINPAGSKYPAVTAMEQKVFHKDYSSEPVKSRLARLEQSQFGKPSTSDDLVDRMDQLKAKTGVDITKQVANGTDWDDEDDNTFAPPTGRRQSSPLTYAPPGEDGRSFSGRDLRKDLNKAFNRTSPSSVPDDGDVDITTLPGSKPSPAPPASSWSTGGSSGSYGFGNSMSYAPPRSAPSYRSAPTAGVPEAPGGMGMKAEVDALENEIFGKVTRDPLPERLKHLEITVFPKDPVAVDKSLPDRVSRLLAAVPISATSTRNKRVASNPDELSSANVPPMAPQRSGLGKIMNSLGNMLGGGGMGGMGMGGMGMGGMGGYPVMSGNLVTDQSTGLLMDPTTGNLIDPSSGAVIGRRVVQPNYGGMPGGLYNPYGSMNSFSTGFSPYGSSNGIGGSGIRFGAGRPMGMWP